LYAHRVGRRRQGSPERYFMVILWAVTSALSHPLHRQHFSLYSPARVQITPAHGPSIGTLITVHGKNFGAVSVGRAYRNGLIVQVGGRPCASVDHRADSTLVCALPTGLERGKQRFRPPPHPPPSAPQPTTLPARLPSPTSDSATARWRSHLCSPRRQWPIQYRAASNVQ
jgi:hypothetical protein